MKNPFITTLFILVFVVVGGCSHRSMNHDYPAIRELSPDTVLSELEDTFFISPQIKCMDVCNGNLYYSDYSGEVVIVNPQYKVIKRIGFRGQGPGELLGPAHFYIANEDSLYILNEWKQNIELFVNGQYAQRYPFPEHERFTSLTRFFANGQHLYHSILSEKAPVIVYGIDSSLNKYLGNSTKYDKPEFVRHSTRHVVNGDGSFLVVGCVYPILQVYTYGGDLQQEYDLTNVPEIKEMVAVYNSKAQVPNQYFTIVQDAYFCNQKLYLLIGRTEKEKYNCHTICVFHILHDRIEHESTLYLSREVYDTFCVKENRVLYAYSASDACIDVFNIE